MCHTVWFGRYVPTFLRIEHSLSRRKQTFPPYWESWYLCLNLMPRVRHCAEGNPRDISSQQTFVIGQSEVGKQNDNAGGILIIDNCCVTSWEKRVVYVMYTGCKIWRRKWGNNIKINNYEGNKFSSMFGLQQGAKNRTRQFKRLKPSGHYMYHQFNIQ